MKFKTLFMNDEEKHGLQINISEKLGRDSRRLNPDFQILHLAALRLRTVHAILPVRTGRVACTVRSIRVRSRSRSRSRNTASGITPILIS